MLHEVGTTLVLARAQRRRDREGGQILVLFTLVVVVLMALAAVVIDVGMLRTDGARLQNALDAGALAAGLSLPADGSNVDDVRATAVEYTQRNFPGVDAPATGFVCLIGIDANGLPRVADMPTVCNVSLAANSSAWRCTGTVCWAPCDPTTVSTDVCNTVILSDAAIRDYTFGRAVNVNSGSTGTLTSTACTGLCGSLPTAPVDVVLVIDRTLSMQGDEANLRNAAGAVLEAYDPALQHVALGMLGPSSEVTPCASGGHGEPLVSGTLTAPSYASDTSGSNAVAGATTLQVSKPSGTAAGDVLVAGITLAGGTAVTAVTPPAGWTLVARRDNATNVGLLTYYRVATATDASATTTSYTWTFASSRRASGGIIRFTGVDTSDPVDATSANSGTGTTLTASGVTTTTAQTTLVGFFSSNSSTTVTPSGTSALTEQFEVKNASASGPTGEGASRAQAGAGATGTRTATTTTSAAWVAQLIALRPVPVESYSIAYPVTPYPASVRKWIPVGLTGTSDAEVIDSYLNADGSLNQSSEIVKTINCVQPGHLYTGTDLATPMDFAWKYLRDHARPGVKQGIIFETDGTPQTQNFTCAQATAAANAAKAAGVEVFTIGFSLEKTSTTAAPVCPDNTSRTALTQLASMATNSTSIKTTSCDADENTDGDHFFCTPAGSDLQEVFRAAAQQLSGGTRLVQLYPRPIVTGVSASCGAAAGGATVDINGKYFTDAYSVTFGATKATSFKAISDTEIRATAPAGTPGSTVDIRVSTPGGSSKIVAGDRCTYGP